MINGVNLDEVSEITGVSVEDIKTLAQTYAEAGKASINGISIVPVEKALWHGRQLIDFRTEVTVEAMRKAIAGPESGGGENSPAS